MQKYINAWNEMLAILIDFINAPKIKNAFLWGIALYAIALFALIRGDIYYADDWGSSSRETSWNHFSRYLGTFILNYLSTLGKGSIDSSPLLQIMAVILVVLSSMILLYLIRKKFDWLGILASLPLGLSPHFLENLSYKFESLFMCVALFFAILPFLFKENRRIFSVVSVISLLCMFMSYQAANGTYIILSLYFAFSAYFLENRSFKESAIFLAICGANLIIASLIYKFVIAEPVSEFTITYASDAMIALNSHFFVGIWANLSAYLTTIFNDFKQTPYIWLVALITLLFVINITIRTNRNKIATIFATILFLALGICLSYGLYLVLQKPILHLRVFYGFGAFVAILCIANISFFRHSERDSAKNPQIKGDSFLDSSLTAFAQNDEVVKSHSAPPHLQKTTHYISCVVVVIMAYFLISFANIYGNALKKQDEYTAFRAELLLQDLLKNNIRNNAVITIKGSLGYSAVTKRFVDKYGDISRLVWRYTNVNWLIWSLTHFNAPYSMYFGAEEVCEWIQENFDSEVIFKNAYHTIERVKFCYVVTIKE